MLRRALSRLHKVPDMKVLDPFAGADTTGLAALRHGRDAVLIVLNSEYCKIMEQRLAGEAIGTLD